jgi:hypothetical protein
VRDFTSEGTVIDMWKSPAEILANSRRTLPKAHLSEHTVTLQLGGGSQLWTPNAAGTRKNDVELTSAAEMLRYLVNVRAS